jgi:hypothetical protein
MEMMEGDSVVWETLPSGVGWATIEEGGGELLRVFNIYGLVSVRTSTQKRGGMNKKRKNNTLLHSRTKRKKREKGNE